MTFDLNLAKIVSDKPKEAIKAAKNAAKAILRLEQPKLCEEIGDIYVHFTYPAGYNVKLREISTEHLNKLISFKGLLTRVSQVYPIISTAVFRCNRCGATYRVHQTGLQLKQPTECGSEKCKGKKSKFTLIPTECEYKNIQFGRIQENPEELPPGRLPHFIDIEIQDDLIEKARPGDTVAITGILKVKGGRGKGKNSTVFQFVLETNYIEPLTKEPSSIVITEEEEEEFKRISKEGNVFERLVDSFAPSIYGLRSIKESLLLSLFGGVEKVLPDGVKVRGDIHVLIIGDPGTAKSELLKYVVKIAPKGVYTSGRGSTAAGLTAAVIREKEGGLALEAGAVVIADRGICAIDEIDKMRPEDRVAIHEAMEQQTVSIAKGGIIATLNARTTIIAAANPAEGRYNPNRLIKDNINLPITLLSRFDLIHVIIDEPNAERDKSLVEHVLDYRSRRKIPAEILPPEFIRKYIAYAKRLKPELTEEAKNKIKEFYLKMRERASADLPISISARQLDAIIRLSEARARAELMDKVEPRHVDDAIRLVLEFLRQVGMDTSTGAIDVDIIMSGIPQKRRTKRGIILTELEVLERRNKGPVPRERLIEQVMKHSKMTREEIERLIDELIRKDGSIYEPRPGFLSRV